ncbi:MAG: hypothetical protein H5U04_06810 [Firmicutes bacterium]|nr:hypothetical protein [Bacillota bacterium]
MEVIRMESVEAARTPRGVMGRKLVDIPAVHVMNLILQPGEEEAFQVLVIETPNPAHLAH